MKPLYIVFLVIYMFLVACNEDEKIDTTPVYTGELSAKIDSLNNFSINVSKSIIDTSSYNNTKIISIEAIDNGSNTLLIYIPSRDTGLYSLATGIESTIRYNSKQGIMYRGKAGKIHVTKADFINKKLSGTFDAKLLQTGSSDTIYVTDGLFVDLPLPKKQ